MEQTVRDRIKEEIRIAGEYLDGACSLLERELFTPCVLLSFYSAFHATKAVLLAGGVRAPGTRQSISGLRGFVEKFDQKLAPMLERLKEFKKGLRTSMEYTEEEARFRVYQARELFLEVKDFLRRFPIGTI